MSSMNPFSPRVARTARRRSLRSFLAGTKPKALEGLRPEVESLESRIAMAADPVISEFQAINVSTIKDKDGDYSDWIEIRNPDINPANLAGWYLTDDPNNLTQWRFPAGTTIAPGKEMLVWASGKDLTLAGQELHTNFRLSADGEFLALVRPDGRTITQSFNPYPAQVENQSYGLAITRNVYELVTPTSAAKALVPTGDTLGTTWMQPDFNDSAWKSGTLGAGYETLATGVTEQEEFNAGLGGSWTTNLPADSAAKVEITGGNLRMTLPTFGQDVSATARGLAPMVYRSLPGAWHADYEIVTQVTQGSTDRGNAGIAIVNPATGLPIVQMEYNSRTTFRMYGMSAQKGTVSSSAKNSYFLRIVRDSRAGTYTGFFKLNAADNWTQVGVATDGVDSVPVLNEPFVGMYARTPTSTMTADFAFFSAIVPNERPTYGSTTGLDLTNEMRGKNASVYLRIPFTYNGPTGLDELNLTAMYDDGFRAFLNGVELESENVPIDSPWNAAATTNHGAVNGVIPEEQFSVAAKLGALRQGSNVLAIHGMNVAKDDGDFYFNGRLNAADVLAATNQFFITPTPGLDNQKPAAPTPVIVGQQGTFFGSTEVSLRVNSQDPNLEIRYTTNGTDPTPTSTLYTGPFTLTKSAMLQVRVFDKSVVPNFVPSNIASGTFVAVSDTLKERSSDLPLLVLDTLGQGLQSASTTSLTSTNVVLFDTSKVTGRSKLGGSPVDYLGRGGLRDRGSSTSGQTKPNMAFETWGPEGNTKEDDADASLLGMPSESDWVLHAPFQFDAALIRNQVAFDLTREMGIWAPRYRLVEVFFNRNSDGLVNETDYYGVYVLMEKIKEGPDRVDVKDITPADNTEPNISGGYIWKVDREDPDAPGFSAGGQGMNWVYPKSPNSRTAEPDQKATTAQQAWVTTYFNNFRKTLTNPNINDPEGYSKYIDPESWVDNHLINVFMMNVDALRLSAYFYKDRDQRVDYGPPWDFDRSAESSDDRDDNPLVWRSTNGDLGTDFFGNGTQQWWGDLFKDPGFWQLYVDRWTMWRNTVMSDENVGKLIDGMAADLAESQVRNAVKWTASRPRTTSGYKGHVLNGTYQGEIDNIKKWLKERAAFMDANFARPVQLLAAGSFLPATAEGALVAPGTQIELPSPPLEFYTDTTIISGEPNVTSARSFIPVNDDLGTRWTEIGFVDASWTSGKTGVGFQDGTDFNGLIFTNMRPSEKDPAATTTLVRIPFNITNAAEAKANRLVLRAQYDDGYVAYLNGVEIRRANMRDTTLTWTAKANTRTNTLAKTFETVDISQYANLLVQGTNVLSFRSVNSSSTSNDMLLVPELLSRKVSYGVNPKSKVYYSTDGTDPRGPNGQPTASAKLIAPGEKLTINQNTRIIARNFDDSDRGTQSKIVKTNWSAPIRYDLITQAPNLVVSEINYNPVGPTAAQAAAGLTDEDFEFIEIHNPTSAAADLVGVRLTQGVDFDFYTSSIKSIPAGGYVLVVNNKAAFEQRYGAGLPIAGEFKGNLDDVGERVELELGDGRAAFDVTYGTSDPWPAMASGEGATLELAKPGNTALNAQGKWYNWRSSSELNGTPGKAGKGPAGIVINEILARTEAPVTLSDSIELHNTTGAAINLGGWFLSDSAANPFKYEIPAGTTVAAGGYVVFRSSQFNAPTNPDGFSLSALGESVFVTRGNKTTKVVSEFVDNIEFGATLNGEAWGRVPNGSGRLAPLSTNATLGAANPAPKVGPIVITEIGYNPVANAAALAVDPNVDPDDLEFLEIFNPTAAQVDISGWRVRGGSDFDLPVGTKLSANEAVVVLKFDPSKPENALRVSAFRAQYGITPAVRLLGGYTGQLNNNCGDVARLMRPDATADPVDPPFVQVDEVLYDDLAPWPTGADGTGQTLQRISGTAFGNASASWFSANGSPGTLSTSTPGDFDGNRVVNVADINLLYIQLQSPTPDVKYDLTGDGKVDNADRDEMVLKLAGTTYGDSNFDRVFNSADFIVVFQVGEYEDGVPKNSTWGEGDWNADGDFTTADLVLAFQAGGYVSAASPAASRVAIAAAIDSDGVSGGETASVNTAPATLTAASIGGPTVASVDSSVASLFADDDRFGTEQDDDDDDAADELAASLANDGAL
jgi:hypothetical protein